MKLKNSANTRHYLKIILLLLVFLIGLVLRLKLFPTNNTWIGDIGRDMLAGHLIAFKGMNTKLGHYNSGTSSIYPSFYYYFIAFLTHVGKDSYASIANILIIYQSVGIILVFFIIKNAFSYLPALAVSTFYALANEFVYFALMPITAHNSIVIALSSMLLLQIALKKRSLLAICFSSILLILASTFFYGAIFLIPLYVLLILTSANFKKFNFDSIVLLVVFLLTTFISFSSFFRSTIGWNFFSANSFNTVTKNMAGNILFTDFFEKVYSRFELMHPKLTIFSLSFYFIAMVIGLFNKNHRKAVLVFAFTIFAHALLYALHRDPLDHYLIYIYLLLLFTLGYGLRILLNKSKLLFIIFTILLLISGGSFSYQIDDQSQESYRHYQKIAELVKKTHPNFLIEWYQNCLDYTYGQFDWESRAYWYFQRDQSFFDLSDRYSQIEAFNSQTVFLCKVTDYVPNKKANIGFKLDNTNYLVFEETY